MSSSIGRQQELEIYTQYLQIPLHACPPNHFRLLGLTPELHAASIVQKAARARIDHLRTIQDPELRPAAGEVIKIVEGAASLLCDPVRAKGYLEKSLSLGQSAPKPASATTSGAASVSQHKPTTTPKKQTTSPRKATATQAAEEIVDLDPSWMEDPLQKPAPAPAKEDASDISTRTLILISAWVGGGTLFLLVLLIAWSAFTSDEAPVIAELPPETPIQETSARRSEGLPPSAPASVKPTTTPAKSPPAPVKPVVEPDDWPTRSPLPGSATSPPTPSTSLPAPDADEPVETESAPPPTPSAPSLPTSVSLPAQARLQDPPVLLTLPDESNNIALALDAGAIDAPFTLELKAGEADDADLAWDVLARLREGSDLSGKLKAGVAIGQFWLSAGKLRYRWVANSTLPESEQLRNCVLEIKQSNVIHRVALRKPVTAATLAIALEERRERIDLDVQHWPLEENLFLEVSCGGFIVSPTLEPEGGRVEGKQRGKITLPEWERAEILFSLAGTGDTRTVMFEPRFFLNKGEVELTFTRARRSLEDLTNGLERKVVSLATSQNRLIAANREAQVLQSSPAPVGLAARAQALLRAQRLQALSQEATKAASSIRRLQIEIPRTQENIAEVQDLLTKMEDWTDGKTIQWRVGVKTSRGELTLVTTQ